MVASLFTPPVLDAGSLRNLLADFYLNPEYVFSDVAGTIPASLNGPVRSVLDRSFNENLLIFNQDVTYRFGIFDGFYLDIPTGTNAVIAGLTPDSDDFFVATSVARSSVGLSILVGANAAAAATNYWYLGGNNPYVFSRAGIASPQSSVCQDQTGTVVAGLWQNGIPTLYMNTAPIIETGGSPSGIETGISFFSSSSLEYPYVGRWYGAVIANSTTEFERQFAISYLRSRHTECRIVASGSSMTAGFGGATPFTDPLQTALDLTYGSGNITIDNIGVVGQTVLEQIDAFYTTDQYLLGNARSVAIFWGLVNDIFDGSIGARQAVDRMKQFCQQNRTNGAKVIVLNCLPTTNGSVDPGFEAIRVAANTLLADEWPDFADGFVDVAGDSRLQDPSNTTNFQGDELHLTTAGNLIVAELVEPHIDLLDLASSDSSDFEYVVGYMITYDENGSLEADVPVTCTFIAAPEGDVGHGFDSLPRIQYSDDNGRVSFSRLIPGASYRIRRGVSTTAFNQSSGILFTIPLDATSPYSLPSVIGQE